MSIHIWTITTAPELRDLPKEERTRLLRMAYAVGPGPWKRGFFGAVYVLGMIWIYRWAVPAEWADETITKVVAPMLAGALLGLFYVNAILRPTLRRLIGSGTAGGELQQE